MEEVAVTGYEFERTSQTNCFVSEAFSAFCDSGYLMYFLTVAAGEISIAPEARGR